MAKDDGKAPQKKVPQQAVEEVEMSPPWGGSLQQRITGNEIGGSSRQAIRGASAASVRQFVTERSAVHLAYIVEQEKTKRLSLAIAGGLLALAVALPVFAPSGRETLSYLLGAALFVFAAGAAGYARVWAKAPKIEFRADDGGDTPG
jgi:hypothetical protein